jgi:hypothetical protein
MFVPKRVVKLRLDVSPFISQSLAGSDVRAVRRISGTGLRTFWLFGSKLGRRPRSWCWYDNNRNHIRSVRLLSSLSSLGTSVVQVHTTIFTPRDQGWTRFSSMFIELCWIESGSVSSVSHQKWYRHSPVY